VILYLYTVQAAKNFQALEDAQRQELKVIMTASGRLLKDHTGETESDAQGDDPDDSSQGEASEPEAQDESGDGSEGSSEGDGSGDASQEEPTEWPVYANVYKSGTSLLNRAFYAGAYHIAIQLKGSEEEASYKFTSSDCDSGESGVYRVAVRGDTENTFYQQVWLCNTSLTGEDFDAAVTELEGTGEWLGCSYTVQHSSAEFARALSTALCGKDMLPVWTYWSRSIAGAAQTAVGAASDLGVKAKDAGSSASAAAAAAAEAATTYAASLKPAAVDSPQQQQQQEEFPQPEEEPQPPQQQGQRWGGWASKMPSLSNGQSTPNAGAARGQPQPGTQSRSGGQPAGKTNAAPAKSTGLGGLFASSPFSGGQSTRNAGATRVQPQQGAQPRTGGQRTGKTNAAPAKSTGFGGLFASSPLSSGQSTPNAAATRGQPQQGKRSRPVGQPTGVGWLAMSRGQSTPNTAAARGQPRSGGFQNPGQMQRPPQQMQRPPQQMQRPRKTRRFM